MAISLKKGSSISLKKEAPGLTKISVGLGWNVGEGSKIDLDASAFLLKGDRVSAASDFVFYSQLKSGCGSVVHTGDNRTGAGDGDDESINIDLALTPSAITRIVFTVTIDEARERRQHFGLVTEAYVRIFDEKANREIGRYDLAEDFAGFSSLEFAALVRRGDSWEFEAIGQGLRGGLAELCEKFGVDTE